MLGLMQDWPLVAHSIIDHAARFHANRPIVSREPDGSVSTTTWRDLSRRARQTAAAIRRLGVRPGERVGVMAWNARRHLECWYGVPGAGAVNHSLNPRLFDDQLVYIIDHAEDRWLFADPDLAPLIARLKPRLPKLQGVVFLCAEADMPSDVDGALCFDALLAAEDPAAPWAEVDERDACGMCYTSGTTGRPKGVVYSHRSNVLHAMAMLPPDVMGLHCRDTVMPVVPLFHANGWSIGFAAPMTGAAVALPGRELSSPAIYDMLERNVTITLAVPAVWLGLLRYLEETGKRFSTLNRVVIGGSACPEAVIEKFETVYGVQVIHAWGMTETSSLGTAGTFTPEIVAADPATRRAAQVKSGRPFYGIDMKIADDDGQDLPRDGETTGHLMCRGFACSERYLGREESAVDDGGWFDTGDVGSIDSHGYIRITDRSKDVIKSGGEWISSIELENLAVGCPGVAEAAAVGVAHPKWGERPVLAIVVAPGETVTREAVLETVAKGVAKWQVPDDVLFVDEIPHTATGKISKLELRGKIAALGYTLPS